jgi:hypothetical protein
MNSVWNKRIKMTTPRYEDYLPMLHKEAYRQFLKGRSLDLNEMISNANLAFVKVLRTFDQNRCREEGYEFSRNFGYWWMEPIKFSTHLYYHLKDELWFFDEDILTKAMRSRKYEPDNGDNGYVLSARGTTMETSFETVELLHTIQNLSKLAQKIVWLILDPPDDFMDQTQTISPTQIITYFRKKGVAIPTCKRALKEIKNALQLTNHNRSFSYEK